MERKEYGPEFELDPERAHEQAESESLARDLLIQIEQEYKNRPGTLDDPEMYRQLQLAKENLSSEAEQRSEFMRARQFARVELADGTLKQSLIKWVERVVERKSKDPNANFANDEVLWDARLAANAGALVESADRVVRQAMQEHRLAEMLPELQQQKIHFETAYLKTLTEAQGYGLEALEANLRLMEARERLEKIEELISAAERLQAEEQGGDNPESNPE